MKKAFITGLILVSLISVFNSAPTRAGGISCKGGQGGPGGTVKIRGACVISYINLIADAGIDRNGGKLSFRDKDEEFKQIEGTWTYRALDDCCLEYPEYVSSMRNKTKLLIAKVEDGTATAPPNQANISDWYSAFKEALVNNFHPVVRGAIGVRLKVHSGGVQSIEFYGYNPAIPFYKDESAAAGAPPTLAQSNLKEAAGNEKALKDNVSATLAKTAKALAAKFPADAPDVDLKFIFAGDPQGKGYWWTSCFLIDKAYYAHAGSTE
jgi:hypothetical protein